MKKPDINTIIAERFNEIRISSKSVFETMAKNKSMRNAIKGFFAGKYLMRYNSRTGELDFFRQK